jgi:hypothetical protein
MWSYFNSTLPYLRYLYILWGRTSNKCKKMTKRVLSESCIDLLVSYYRSRIALIDELVNALSKLAQRENQNQSLSGVRCGPQLVKSSSIPACG